MAEADGKFTGVPAVALGSRGPGASNLAIGVHTAFQDETPMLVLLGQVESARLGRESFQEVDLAAFFAPLAKWSRQTGAAADVPGLVAEALGTATTGRPGPAVLAVPGDFWAQPYGGELPTVEAVPPGDDASAGARAIAEALDAATAPVVIAGGGVRQARAELVATAERLGLAVYTAFRRQDAFPEDHPQYAGHLGLGAAPDLLEALERADLVLVLGTRLDEVTSQDYRFPLDGQRLIMAGSGVRPPDRDGPTLSVDVDVLPLLQQLQALATPRSRNWSVARAAVDRFTTAPTRFTGGRVHPTDVVRTMRRLAPDGTVVTNDAGNFAGFVHRYWGFTEPRTQLAPVNGAMGYAVPAAVAAKMASPESTVVAMVGDGGVLMTGQEVETAVRHGLAMVVVVFQNGLYGTIAMHQAKVHGRLAGVTIGALDLAGWARGLGAEGLTVDTPDQLEATLARALACGCPCVVDVRTDPDVITADHRLAALLDDHR
jgi:acetolactate synthase-1/2/3 large subunit